MNQIITKIYCDVCKKETKNEEVDIQVIFTTEQNEGKKCPPYLCNEKLNLCDDCIGKILNGNYIFSSGGMGCNTYSFKND